MRKLRHISQRLFSGTLTTILFVLSTHVIAGAGEIQSALNSDKRTAGDSERDAGRKPAEVLAFLGVSEGSTVLDLMASGGWYTEVMSLTVGESGKVYAQNSPAFLKFRDGYYDKALTERLAGNRLPNVQRINADFNAMGLENEVDVAITALNFHDIYNRNPDDAIAMLKDVKKALKPGGVIGLIDHDGNPEADNNKLHRMTKAQAIAAAEAAGYEVTSSDLLSNSEDDHTQGVFSQGLRGKTDRFLLKLKKPM
ncbi:class I SAM-dependent methyltransferase [Aurantivibrio plasticivorans]